MPSNPYRERYFRVLQQVVTAGADADVEVFLADAFELGRAMVDRMVPPEEVANLHHEALLRLAQEHPHLSLGQVADQLSRPLLEMNMAYGMVFRQHMARRDDAVRAERLAQARKMESIGTLAAGIAHDFNNILGSIVGFAEMAGDELPDGSTGKNSIEQVLEASFRARELVARMLTFARQQGAQPVVVDALAEVRGALALLRAVLPLDIALSLDVSTGPALVMAEPTHLQQVVENLCRNAAQAIAGPGAIGIRIESRCSGEAAPGAAADRLCLTVADDGGGITPENLGRVFDPFFTTRAPGEGSGLGLSVVHGIVSQLGGTVEIQSKSSGPQTGTVVQVTLPLVKTGKTNP